MASNLKRLRNKRDTFHVGDWLKEADQACDTADSYLSNARDAIDKAMELFEGNGADEGLLFSIYRLLDDIGPMPSEHGSIQQRAWDLKHQIRELL